MKAIILAAGQGIRLRPLTDDRPKCLVEYKEKPLLDYILSSMRSCQITEIVVVRGYKGEVITHEGVSYKENDRYASTNMVSTLFAAEDEMNDDVIVSYSDIIYRPEVLQPLIDSQHPISVVVDTDWRAQWEARMENPLEDAETMKFNQDGSISELGLKPKSYDDIQGQYIGLVKFKSDTLKKVRDFYHALDQQKDYRGKSFDQMYMTTFLQLIIDELMPVHATFIQGGWLEVDSHEDLQYDLDI